MKKRDKIRLWRRTWEYLERQKGIAFNDAANILHGRYTQSVSRRPGMSETIFLRLGTKEGITLSDFIDSLSDFKGVLQELDATIANDKQGNMVWEVVALSKQSPALVGVAPRLKKGREDISVFVENQLIENVRLLGSTGERTQHLSDKALKKFERLSARASRLGNLTVYLNGSGPIRDTANITQDTLNNVKQLTSAKFSEYGSIYGSLDTISVHKGHEFRIWNEENNKVVRCFFHERELETVKGFLKTNVVVSGIIESNAARLPISIRVEDLKQAPKFQIPTIREIIGLVPNITEGLSMREYMQRLSDE